MALIVLRCLFMIVAVGVSVSFFRSELVPQDQPWVPWIIFFSVMMLASGVILVDILFPRKRIDTISAVYFGIVVGLFLTYAVGLALAPLFDQNTMKYLKSIQLVLGVVLCYSCISLLLQTKDDFRFIIPYVEFSREVKGLKPYILDTSVVIDGRIADVLKSQFIDNPLVIPRFVLLELQAVADSSDKLRRTRGRRGLDVLNDLRGNKAIDLKIYDRETPEMENQPVDMKLVLLAKHLDGKIITGDFNLNKIARVQNVAVVNLNDLAASLRPQLLPGETVEVKIIKSGEQAGQGIGYLDDGTMVVVEGGREHVQQIVRVGVTNIVQSSAGRMIFAKYEGQRAAAEVS